MKKFTKFISRQIDYRKNIFQEKLNFPGFGVGLMMPACFTSFNDYFDRKQNLMMSISQALLIAVTVAWPLVTQHMLDTYGFRGTLAMLAAISLHSFPACLVLQPVESHMKKVFFEDDVPRLDGLFLMLKISVIQNIFHYFFIQNILNYFLHTK